MERTKNNLNAFKSGNIRKKEAIEVLFEILIDHLEQHKEQEKAVCELMDTEPETIKCDMNKGLYNDERVEVGQIWRLLNGTHIKVTGVSSNGKRYNGKHSTGSQIINCENEHLYTAAKLVTMDNIQVGEWIECKHKGGFTGVSEGEKFNIVGIYYNGIEFYDSEKVLRTLDREYFKPCLPPVETKEGCYICDDTSNDRYFKNKKYNYCPYCGEKIY